MTSEEKIEYDYSKLIGRIKMVCKTQFEFAVKMNWSERTVSFKLNNVRSWKQPDIEKAMLILHIDRAEMLEYFFCRIGSA